MTVYCPFEHGMSQYTLRSPHHFFLALFAQVSLYYQWGIRRVSVNHNTIMFIGWEPPFSILLHFHSTNAILLVATFYHIMLLCSPHRTATPSTQKERDSPASERQPVTQVEETDHDQTWYKVHSDCSFTSTCLLPF